MVVRPDTAPDAATNDVIDLDAFRAIRRATKAAEAGFAVAVSQGEIPPLPAPVHPYRRTKVRTADDKRHVELEVDGVACSYEPETARKLANALTSHAAWIERRLRSKPEPLPGDRWLDVHPDERGRFVSPRQHPVRQREVEVLWVGAMDHLPPSGHATLRSVVKYRYVDTGREVTAPIVKFAHDRKLIWRKA